MDSSDAEGTASERSELVARIAALEEELAAARRTREVLIRRVETQPVSRPAEAFSVAQAMAGLEDAVRASTRQLAESEAHFRSLYNRGPDMIFTIDASGRVLDRNELAKSLGDVPRFPELFEPPAAVEQLVAGGFKGVGEREFLLVDQRRVLLAAARLAGDQWAVALRDITEYRALEQELSYSRRLASMGRLAAGIAKEINNPLAVILGRLELLVTLGYSDPELLARHLAVVGDHAQRIAQFVRFLDVLARPGVGQVGEVALDQMLERVEQNSGRRLGHIRVERSVDPPEMVIRANPQHLEMAFSALFNACGDAMHRKGRLVIRAWLEEGQCVLELRGPGLSSVATDLRYVDEWDRGDGGMNRVSLGLAATIIAEHGGWLGAIGEGGPTAFLRLFLPSAPARRRPRSGGELRVLIVDDEEPMGELLRELLRTAGHEGVAVLSAEAALSRLEREGFDAVICDLVMPGMNGTTLLETIRDRWPALHSRVLLMSGYDQQSIPGTRFLRKPFTRDQLLEALDAVVA